MYRLFPIQHKTGGVGKRRKRKLLSWIGTYTGYYIGYAFSCIQVSRAEYPHSVSSMVVPEVEESLNTQWTMLVALDPEFPVSRLLQYLEMVVEGGGG